MTDASLAIVLLPGPGDAEATLASVRAEAGDDAHLVPLTTAGQDAKLPPSVETVAFARSGDRWLAGTLAARLRPLRAHPRAALSVAAHVLVDDAGAPVLTVAPPALPLDPAELLLRASVEPSAVLARASALDAAALALLAAPHGDRVLWSRLARAHGLVRSTEIAAEVPLDVGRHSSDPAATTTGLLAAAQASATEAEQPGAITLRRELLRRLYVEGDQNRDEQPVDLAILLGEVADERVLAVIADLQWALERTRDALAAERVRWPAPTRTDEDEPTAFADEELFDLRAAVRTMVAEVEVRDALIRRYEAEILRRDAIIARMSANGEPSADRDAGGVT